MCRNLDVDLWSSYGAYMAFRASAPFAIKMEARKSETWRRKTSKLIGRLGAIRINGRSFDLLQIHVSIPRLAGFMERN